MRAKKIKIERWMAVMVMAMVALVGYSCSADMAEGMHGDMMAPPALDYYTAIGTIDSTTNTFVDDNNTVWQIEEVSELAEKYPLQEVERALVCYTPVDWSVPSLRLNSITKVVTKDVLLLDELSEEQQEALGVMHLNPHNVSISGGFVNVSCNTHVEHTAEQAAEHYNMVFDTDNSTADTALFMLRSNLADSKVCDGVCYDLVWLSFRLSDDFGELYPQHPLYVFNWYSCATNSSELTYGKLNITLGNRALLMP